MRYWPNCVSLESSTGYRNCTELSNNSYYFNRNRHGLLRLEIYSPYLWNCWIPIYYFQVLTEQALMYHLFIFSFKNIQQNWNDTSKILEIGIYRIGEVTYQKKINACVTSFYLIMIKKVSVFFFFFLANQVRSKLDLVKY